MLFGYDSLDEALTAVLKPWSSKSSKPRRASLKTPIKDKDSDDGFFRSVGVMYGHSSMQGWRDSMEDAHLAVQLGSALSQGGDARNPAVKKEWDSPAVFGVFDGHGGAQVAHFCANHLTREVEAAGWRGKSVSEALHESFHTLDRLLQEPKSQKELKSYAKKGTDEDLLTHGCGCTAAACCVLKTGDIVVANAGDCRVVLSRQGQAMPLSQDHKPNLPQESRRIHKAGGQLVEKNTGSGNRTMFRINGGLNVSRTIGDFKYKKNDNLPQNGQMVCCTPELMGFRRSKQDEFIVIACDGVWDVLSSQQVVDAVRKHLPAMLSGDIEPSEVAAEVLDLCLSPNLRWTDGLGGDNMTLMILVFTAPEESNEHLESYYSLLRMFQLGQTAYS